MKDYINSWISRKLPKLHDFLGRSLFTSIALLILIAGAMGLAVFLFFNSAAPTKITILAGPQDSIFRKLADKYKTILAKEGIRLKIIESEGSLDNLKKLADPAFKANVAFVQGGETEGVDIDNLVSLGSISYQPLAIFYTGEPKTMLTGFKGQRLDIGPKGCGSHILTLALLKANGIDVSKDVTLIDTGKEDIAQALIDNRIDAIFTMTDSVSLDTLRKLMRAPNVRLFSFSQADAYTRRFNYLSKLELPKGTFDIGRNIPAEDVYMLGPTVELIARNNLHPALVDILLETAREVHGPAGIFKKSGEFPSLVEHEIRISPDATRYYTSGKSYLYRTFPFWLASLINRSLAAILPIVLLVIPAAKLIPVIWRWRMRSKIYRWYKVLFALEHDMFNPAMDEKKRGELLLRLDHIEKSVNMIKVPSPFGEELYSLKGHINFVREKLLAGKK